MESLRIALAVATLLLGRYFFARVIALGVGDSVARVETMRPKPPPFPLAHSRAQRRQVVIGHRNDFEAAVHQRLEAGDTVTLHPGDRVADGNRVSWR